jgi:glycosyltransferase involved in cell wall biosynthesis
MLCGFFAAFIFKDIKLLPIMKKISILGTVGIPNKYGGFETLVENLTKNLSHEYDITVFRSAKSYDDKLHFYNGARLKDINLRANGVQSIPYDIIAIFCSLKFATTLLILGVSGCIILPFIRLFSRKRIIVNIDGMEWKREKWGRNAKWFLKLSEKLAVKYADIIVSDNKVIQEYVFTEYGVRSELIAYGADHVVKEHLSDGIQNLYPFLNTKYTLKVCRIEPENNVHLILEVFSKYISLNIVMIGNWGNSKYGKELKVKYCHFKNIFLLDPIYNHKILNQIRSNCFIYIHGHSAGGTNPSLVEAMYLGLPIFAFGVAYNKETTQHKANYFNNKGELLSLLKNISADELLNNATDMQNVAKENYMWVKISEQYAKLF